MILFPIGTDAPLKNRPTVNHTLVLLNIGIFLLFDVLGRTPGGRGLAQARDVMILYPSAPDLYQFITYQFFHAGWVHMLGNMWFLWLFGNPVNGKMGNVPYLFFYLAGGVFAGVGFCLTHLHNPVLGASGSIAAVTTAYLVLFPRSIVRMFYWFFVFVGYLEIGSMPLIVGKMIVWDNIITADLLSGPGAERQIAYEAHLSGYAFGFVAAFFMLLVQALPRDPFDILSLWNRWKRRREFAGLHGQPAMTGGPVVGQAGGPQGWVAPAPGPSLPPGLRERITDLRAQISQAIDRFDLAAASKAYRQMIQIDPKQVLYRTNQLDVANQLTAEGDYALAADAYEKFLERYPDGTTVQHVRFLLGVIYARHLRNYPKAIECLEGCRQDLTDVNMARQCDYWLDVARSKGRDQPGQVEGPANDES